MFVAVVVPSSSSGSGSSCCGRKRLRSFEWPDPVGPGQAGRFACGRRKRTARPGATGSGQSKKNAAIKDIIYTD